MISETATLSNEWLRSLPRSRMIFPKPFRDRLKYVFWSLYTPIHPHVRDAALSLRIVKHAGRQDFLLGKIAPGQTFKEFISFLVSKGFANHFIAWKDDGEIVSLRRLHNFAFQYHLRIFRDGEVRGHFEYTPESRPMLHIKAICQENRREEFLRILGDRIVPAK